VAKAYAANGNMGMAYAYMDSAYVARDSFLVERNAVFVSGVQHKIDVEKHKAELNDTAEETRRQNLFKYILIAGILLMFLLATVFFLQQRKLRKTHSKLIQSEKLAALGQLSASIAHEVNTPLGGIKSSAEESLAAFQEFQSGLLWMTQTLNEEEKNLFLNFLATANPINVALSTREEREIKKTLRETFAQMGIENGRFLSERLVQVGIYELSPELEQLSRLPHFEKMLLLAFNLFNQQHSNRTIVTAVDKASRIVKAMKTYLHSANTDKMEEVNLRDNIETVLTIYQNRLKLGVQVIKNYEANPVLTGYPDQLNQIWTNLIVNAVQAMDNQGILTISILEEGNEVVVKIKDTGKGIPKAIQSKIFSPFFTTKKSGEGSGLGLHIIRRIVKEHSGTIDFESVEGEGTTFIVKFPIVQSV
jgi:signal transduction histidine kinase